MQSLDPFVLRRGGGCHATDLDACDHVVRVEKALFLVLVVLVERVRRHAGDTRQLADLGARIAMLGDRLDHRELQPRALAGLDLRPRQAVLSRRQAGEVL
jgi:hypothetical protein